MNLIVATDENGAIGNNNALLFHSKRDMRHFKDTTLGKTIIVGRKTLDSFPNGLPLPGRNVCVLSSSLPEAPESPTGNKTWSCASIKQVLSTVTPDAWVCGGASVYRQLIPFCDTVNMTVFWTQAAKADAWFPDLREHPDTWVLTSWEDFPHDELPMSIKTYRRIRSNIHAIIVEYRNGKNERYSVDASLERPMRLTVTSRRGNIVTFESFTDVLRYFNSRVNDGTSDKFTFNHIDAREEYA